jgi:hypothetical protein
MMLAPVPSSNSQVSDVMRSRVAGFFIRSCVCRLPTIATRLRLTTALAVRLHRAFAGRPFLKPIAICLQFRGKILANTAIPNPKGGRHGNVCKGKTGTHKEFAVTEFITNSVDGALKPGLDSDRRPIALLIVRRTEADRKKGCH